VRVLEQGYSSAALETTTSIRQALLKVGLQAQGANYRRVSAIIVKYNINK
jgi:hypothetical protein